MDLLALLSAALLSAQAPTAGSPAPAATPPAASDAQARAHADALLGTIDRTIAPERWKALGPAAVEVLAAVAASPDERPSRRAKAIAALAAVEPGRAEPIARALVDADGAPVVVRQAAVRALGRILPPDRLPPALAPVLRAAPDPDLRATAAETLARHAPALGCAEVMDQAALEPASGRPAFERAAALCAGR